MPIKRVWIEDGCTSCALCESISPDVFKMEDIATVINGVDYSKYESQIIESAESCPAEVIKYE